MNNKFDEIQKREKALLCSTYGRYPLAISKAKGCRLYDLDGQEYLDFLAGIAVCSLGHCRDDLADVMAGAIKNTLADFRRNVHIQTALAALLLRLQSKVSAAE